MTRTRIFAAILVLIPVAAGVAFWYVGRHEGRGDVEGFDWELASIFGTAVGTFLLAVSTGALALTTARDVSATQEIAQLTRTDQEDRVRPVVIGTATQVGGDAEGTFLSVELWNIGGGPAVQVDVTADHRFGTHVETTRIPTIPAAASSPVVVRLPDLPYRADPDRDPKPEHFKVRGRYLDRQARLVPQEIYDWKHELPPALQS